MRTLGYRRLAGLLLLWSVLPMPFLYVILPPFWLLAAAAALHAVLRPRSTVRLSPAVLNVIAIIILVVVVMTGGLRIGPVRPLGHLLLLLTSVRSLMIEDRRSFFRALPVLSLVWLVAVASSTHATLAIYLAGSAVVWWWSGMSLLLMGLAPEREWSVAELPRLRHAVTAAMVVILLAIPIFIAMPRLRSPWIAGAAGRRTSGFSTSVELSRSGVIGESRELAVMISAPGGEPVDAMWTRLRATAFNMVFAGSWAPRRTGFTAPERRAGLVWLAGERGSLEGTVQLDIEVLRPRGYLFVPEGTVAVRSPIPVMVDPEGGLVVERRIDGPLRYSVWVRREPVPRLAEPLPRDTYLPRRDQAVERLAGEVAGEISDEPRQAAAVETFLRQSYRYSLETSGVQRQDPVAWFLLTGKQGHCEFFAGSMVVLLRHLGIPARFIAGYNGGTLGPTGSTVVVRQSNAHAWVEVWLGTRRGWVVFDPTPGEGVPALEAQSGLERVRWVWARIQDRWDRYVLTFGLGEQIGLISGAAAVLRRLAAGLRWSHLWVLPLGIAGWLLLRRAARGRWRGLVRRPGGRPRVARVVDRLARRLSADGEEVPVQATVRWIGRAARARWPAAEAAVGDLVWLAEHELYAGAEPAPVSEVKQLESRLRRAITAGTAASDAGENRG